MKHFYLSALLAAAAVSSASAQQWVVMQDFESADATAGTNNEFQATVSIETIATDNNPDNRAAQLTKKNHDTTTGIQVSFALPAGKTLADYSKIGFDVYNKNMDYKNFALTVNGTQVASLTNNPIGNQKGWVDINGGGKWEFDLTGVDGSATELTVLVAIAADGNNIYAIDNIRLYDEAGGENPGPVDPVDPSEYTPSTNGTVTGQWLMLEDFQNLKPNAEFTVVNKDGGDSGVKGKVVANGKTLFVEWMPEQYNRYIEIPVTLPEGKTIADYDKISFDHYIYDPTSAEDPSPEYKQMYIAIDGQTVHEDVGENNYPNYGPKKEWSTKEFALPDNLTGNTHTATIRVGLSSHLGHYAINNIRLHEKQQGTPVDPTEYDPSTNGTVTDQWLMLEDFQKHTPGAEFNIFSKWGSDVPNKGKVVAHEDGKTLFVEWLPGDWDRYIEIPVTLPEGKTIADYDRISFDHYIYDPTAADTNPHCKNMHVSIDGQVVHEETNFPNNGPMREWSTKEFALPDNLTGNSNNATIRVGLSHGDGHYAINNIRLHEKDQISTGIADIDAAEAVNVTAVAGAVVVNGNGEVRVYTVDGRAVAAVNVAGNATIELPRGLYIVSCGRYTAKVIVK